jgi:beta-galactosidase
VLVFKSLVGEAEVWLDGVKVADKRCFAPAPLEVPLPPGQTERRLAVLIRAEPGKASGFGSLVLVRER